jgi:hypothetical protein
VHNEKALINIHVVVFVYVIVDKQAAVSMFFNDAGSY